MLKAETKLLAADVLPTTEASPPAQLRRGTATREGRCLGLLQREGKMSTGRSGALTF